MTVESLFNGGADQPMVLWVDRLQEAIEIDFFLIWDAVE